MRPIPFQIAAGITVAVLTVGLALAFSARLPPSPPVLASAAPEPVAPPPPVEDEAADAVAVLRRVWPIGLAADSAEGADKCDKAQGAARRACYAKLLANVEAQRARLPSPPRARTACGREIEEAHRVFVEREAEWLTKQVAWLAKGGSEPLPGEGYAVVMRVECTKRVFRCGLDDNVCTINKVAARLGLGPDAKPSGVHGRLVARATGAVLAE